MQLKRLLPQAAAHVKLGHPGVLAVLPSLAVVTIVAMLIGRFLPFSTAAAWLYLPLALWVTVRWGLLSGLATGLASNAILYIFLVPPLGSLVASDEATYARLAIATVGMVIALLTVAELNRRRRLAEQQGRAEAESLADISRRISDSLDLDEVLQTAADSAKYLVGADIAVIALVDAQQGVYAAATSGAQTVGLRQLAIPSGVGLSAEVLNAGHPVQVHRDDASSQALTYPPALEAMDAEGIVSTLAVPIRHGTEVAGVFWVHTRRHRVFSRNEVALLDRLAAQAGVAIANARALGDERLARAEVEGLLKVTESLGIQASPEAIFRTLVEQAARLLDAERATYAVWRDDRVVIPCVWHNGEWIDEAREVPPGGIAKFVWDSGRPYRTNEIEADPHANTAIVRLNQIRSQLTVPLLGPDSERLGLVSVNNSRRPEGFTAQDERLLIAICETAAEILRRARYITARFDAEQAAARRKQEVEALLTAADRLNSAVDPEQVLQRVVEVAAELFEADRVSISTNEGDQVLIRHHLERGEWTLSDAPIPMDGSLSGWVIRHGRPYRADDLSADKTFEWTHLAPPHAALSMPILGSDGRILGTLNIFDRRDGQVFSDDDERLAEGIAHHAAVALERAMSTTQLRQMAAALREAAKFSEEVIASASQGIVVYDRELRYLVFNPFMEQLTGVPAKDVLGRPALEVFPHLHDQGVDELMRRALAGETISTPDVPYQIPQTNRSGWVVSAFSPHRDPNGRIVGVIGSIIDVTARKELDEQLERQAFFDALTNLPNRARFMQRLERAVARLRSRGFALAVLFLDVDGLKLVNDSLGHAVGDTLLQAAGERLLDSIGPEAMVARFGGDEFALLLEDVSTLDATLQKAQTILQALQTPFAVAEHHTMSISASIGISFRDAATDPLSAEDLIREADTALYRAKAAGKAQAAVFDPSMSRQAIERLEIQTDLRRAVDERELRLYYQPLIKLGALRLSGVEALVRWQHPRRGLLDPDAFIPLAEETGLILPVGAWVIEQACRQAAIWRSNGTAPADLGMSVNLSARQFEQRDLTQQVGAALRRSHLDPSALTLEITETAVIRDLRSAIATLGALKNLGVRVAIDDFGTGYSSLSNLQRLPVDLLKIDRSFMTGLEPNNATAAILEATISMAHALGIEVTAEGIESETQLEILSGLGCDYGQGYYLGMPGPADSLPVPTPAALAPPA
jgi:diguanylate cyclase (GGDEF)-like protein/PAS domain S-box-containing protein